MEHRKQQHRGYDNSSLDVTFMFNLTKNDQVLLMLNYVVFLTQGMHLSKCQCSVANNI